MKQSFVIYYSYREILEDLSDEEVGKLFRALLDYEIDDILPNFKGLMKMAFTVIKGNLDRDKNSYDRRCETSVVNGKLGGRPKKPKKPNSKPKKPKKADNDNENDTDNDNDNESDTDDEKSADLFASEESETNADLFTLIENSFGRTLNSIEIQEISTWEDDDLTRYAVKESILNGARGIRYIETVLSSWKAKGLNTVQDVQAYQDKYKKKKVSKENTPEWFDKEIETEKISKEDKKELDDLLNQFK